MRLADYGEPRERLTAAVVSRNKVMRTRPITNQLNISLGSDSDRMCMYMYVCVCVCVCMYV